MVDELMALCDQLEQQLSQAEQSRWGLLETLLQEALADLSADNEVGRPRGLTRDTDPQADLALEGRA